MATRPRLAGALVLLSAVGLPAWQQAGPPPPPATGLILGRTVDVDSGQPISAAIVTLQGATTITGPAAGAFRPARALTDADGHFVFYNLPKGAYSLGADKPGWGHTGFGSRAAADGRSQALVLADGERRGDVTISMWKYAEVSGSIVDAAGEPVIDLPVRVMERAWVGGRPRFAGAGGTAFTDDRGRYRIGSLTPGDYVVGVMTSTATVPLAWQAAMFGAMDSGDGAAMQRQLQQSTASTTWTMTGQRVGGFSVASGSGPGLPQSPPMVSGGKVFVYPTVFYPSAATPSKATIVTLASGDERSGVDFQVGEVPTARVSGRIVGPDGAEANLGIELVPAATDELDADPPYTAATTFSDATGAFTFFGVPAGAYTIRAEKTPLITRQAADPSLMTVIQMGNGNTIMNGFAGGGQAPVTDDPVYWAQVPVSVSGADVTDVSVPMRAGARLMGHVEFTGAAPQPTPAQLTQINVSVVPAAGRRTATVTVGGNGAFYWSRGSVDASGQFKTYQFPPGRYVIEVAGIAGGWAFAGATYRGRDVSDGPIEIAGEDLTDIVLSFVDKPASLSGTALAGQGPDAASTVLVFPADPVGWQDYGTMVRRLRAVRPGSDGRYNVPNLPAGDYLATAIHSAVPNTWMDPAFLRKAAAGATRVTIAVGERKTQDLRSTEVR